MDTISTLTPEQVRAMAKHIFRAIAGETLASQAARKALCDLIENHEALREQLAEAQADVRALGELTISLQRNLPILQRDIGHYSMAIQALTLGCEEVLARPGVKRVMEKQDDTIDSLSYLP